MADEQEEEGGKKGSLIKIIIIAVVGLVLVGAAIAATLFFTGFFDKKAAEAVAEAVEDDAAPAGGGTGGGGKGGEPPAKAADAKGDGKAEPKSDAKGDAKGGGKPAPRQRATPERVRFEQTYLELERPLLANVTGSRKVMQIRLAIMTYYDERVFNNVKKHEFALRSAILDVMRQSTEADINKPTFRTELAEKIRLTVNALLEKYEDFGGVEEVHFTEFVVQ
jgi:flagellar FliL protein